MALIKSFPAPTGQPISSVDSRKDLAGLVVRSTAGVPRAGILPRHTNALVTARASMGVDVAAFEAVLVRNNLPAFAANDGTTVVPIGAAPTANSRYDIVYAKQNESEAPFSDANNNPVLGYVSGAAAPSPNLAAAIALVPAGGLPLAAVLVPSGAETTQAGGVQITQLFTYSALTGGAIWVRSKTEVGALGVFADGQLATDLSTSITYRCVGGAWRPWSSPPILRTGTPSSILSLAATLGNGQLIAYYQFVEGAVHEFGRFTHGSTSTVAAGSVRLITAAAMDSGLYVARRVGLGGGELEDSGTATYDVRWVSVDASNSVTAMFKRTDTAANRVTEDAITNSVPTGAWAVNDTLSWDVWYLPA